MKKILLLATMVCVSATAMFAQSTKAEMKEVIQERRAALNYTDKQLNTKILKEAKKQAKIMTKQGWTSMPGSLSLERQLTDVYTRQWATDGKLPRYIIGKGIAASSTMGMARKHALARAKVDVAGQMSEEVAALTDLTETSVELTGQEVETIAKMVEQSKLLSQQSLGKTDVILEACRTTETGTEVEVFVCYEGRNAMRALLMQSFGEDSSDIKQKLEKLMQE